MSILKRQVSSSSVFLSFFIVMTHNSSLNFKVIHFLLWAKRSHQSSNFDTFECSGENLLNSSSHFPRNRSVFLQILDHSSVSWKITPLYFFRSNNIYFAQKEPIKMKIFWDFQVLGSKFVKFLMSTLKWQASFKFLMSILKRQVDFSPNFLSLLRFMKDNSFVLS